MYLSKKQIKLINSLQQKKNRIKHGLFVAEGVKLVNELIQSSIVIEHVFAIDSSFVTCSIDKITIINNDELKRISTLKTPNKVLGLFKIPKKNNFKDKGFILVLDGVNDPGNLGTIIRLCDWFGVNQLICSKNTVDCYNQKVIQSTMGSIARIQINYVNLTDFLNKTKLPIFSTNMSGNNVYSINLPSQAVLIMGSEAHGVSDEIKKNINNFISIPKSDNLKQIDSLNVAIATAILVSEFKRG